MGYLGALLVRIHVLTGLVLGLFFALLGLTGAALAFRPALEERLYWPACTACSSSAGGQWESVASRIAGEGKRISMVNLREGKTWEFVAGGRDGSGLISVYVNPGDGSEVSRRTHSESPFAWIYELHTSLLLGRFGMQMTARLGLLLMLQGVLGLLVWRLRGFPFHGHALLGVTAGVLAILLGYSGWAVFTTRVSSVQPVVTLRGIENKVPLDRLVQTAQTRRSGRRLESIYFPGAPSQPYQFWFGDRPSNATIVYMDPYGAILPMLLKDEDNAMRDWHRGPAGGGGARVLRFLTGLGLAGLFATGLGRVLARRRARAVSPAS